MDNTTPFSKSKRKDFRSPDLEIDFLLDLGAESNVIIIPTWIEIQTLHPKLIPFKTSSKLATSQKSSLTTFGKIQEFLVPTQTMEQNKLLTKPFKQTFHKTDIKQNIVGIPYITKYIPTINILNSKVHLKDKYTRMKNASLAFFLRLNKQLSFFAKFYSLYNQERKHLKPLVGYVYNFSLCQSIKTTRNRTNNDYKCQTLNLSQLINFSD